MVLAYGILFCPLLLEDVIASPAVVAPFSVTSDYLDGNAIFVVGYPEGGNPNGEVRCVCYRIEDDASLTEIWEVRMAYSSSSNFVLSADGALLVRGPVFEEDGKLNINNTNAIHIYSNGVLTNEILVSDICSIEDMNISHYEQPEVMLFRGRFSDSVSILFGWEIVEIEEFAHLSGSLGVRDQFLLIETADGMIHLRSIEGDEILSVEREE